MGLFEHSALPEKINDLIRIGEVSSINPKKGTARVVFDDDDGTVSFDLPILQRNTFATKDFNSVNVGEDVLCLFLPTGPEEGFIIGSFYAGEIELPESDENKRTTLFKDGTRISYDMAAHVLTAIIEGTVLTADRKNVSATVPEAVMVTCKTATVKASMQVTVDTPETHVTGNVMVDGSLTVKKLITGQGGFAISGGSGATAKVEGSLETTGDVKSDGDVTAGKISLKNHTHKEQGDGAETSGPH